MNNPLEIDLIIERKKYPPIYNTYLIILIILLITIYIIFTYKYQSYYITKGKIVNNQLELLVNIEDIKYLKNNHTLEIENKCYQYTIVSISNELIDNNYQYIHLKIDNITNIDNYIYEIKIPKENKIIAKYLKEYL